MLGIFLSKKTWESVSSLLRLNNKEMTEQYERLTDSQWAAISVDLDLKRKRILDLRDILDGIFYILRTGCQWRNLPIDYPDWRAIYYLGLSHYS